MAKEGIDAFLLDCHPNENLQEIEAAYGVKGFAVIVRLWQKIYSEKGYYCEWKERSPLLFLSTWFGGGSGVDLGLINEVVGMALKIGIFDEDIYEKYGVLTSDGIQRRYFDVVKRRTNVKVNSDYLLLSDGIFEGNANKKPISAYKNEKNVSRNATSKVKEIKGKESKVKDKEKESVKKDAAGTRRQDALSMVADHHFPPRLEEAIKDWLTYKAERRQPYKKVGLKNLLSQIENKVIAFGDVPVELVIRESMASNYQGIVWARLEENEEKQKRRRNQQRGEIDWNNV